MALTKHEKLEKGIARLLEALDAYYHKTAEMLRCLLLFFHETHLVVGRQLMSEQALSTMSKVHRYGLKTFSPNANVRNEAENLPLVSFVHSLFYPKSRVIPSQNSSRKWIPWGVRTVLSEENIQKLDEAKLAALLYCAAESEMSEWIDWSENEDKAGTFTNQFFAIQNIFQERAFFESNLNQPGHSLYLEAVVKFFGKTVNLKTLERAHFAPKQNSNIFESYNIVNASLKERKAKHLEDFQRVWRDELEGLMFAKLDWPQEKKDGFIAEYFPKKSKEKIRQIKVRGGQTGDVLDRFTYGAFLAFFLKRFRENPMENHVEGEISLLLWIMVYASQACFKPIPIARLLKLTSANVSGQCLSIDGRETDLSGGLVGLLKMYIGDSGMERHRKLFPSLTMDKLEDYFRRASDEILPPGSVAALPEAFLTFPHGQKNVRISPQMRRHQQQQRPRIFHDPISRHELKRQLIEKSRQNLS